MAVTLSTLPSSNNATIPQSQNTAPVLHFSCLFTHDVRRKQKRWQDGRVKFHTFNKRLMLYDDTQNFVGDTHWKGTEGLRPDTEVALEDGIMIQVGDLLTTTQTDLAPLFEREGRKAREKNATPGQTAGASPALSAILPARQPGTGAVQKHRNLNMLLGPSKGSPGQAALFDKSPFEIKQADQARQMELLREAKRRKTQAEPWTVTKTTAHSQHFAKDSSSKQKSQVSGQMIKSQKSFNGQSKLSMRQVVDITSEAENLPMSDVTVSSSPKRVGTVSKAAKTGAKSQTHIQRKPASRLSPEELIRQSSPPVSTKNRARHHDVHSAAMSTSPTKTPTASKTKQLRIGKTRPRAMLLCQKSARSSSTISEDKAVKRRRVNIYQGVSEDDADTVVPEVQSHSRSRPAVPELLEQVDLQEALSDSAPYLNTHEIDSVPLAAELRRPMSKEEEHAQGRGRAQGQIRAEQPFASRINQTAHKVAKVSRRADSRDAGERKSLARKSISIRAAGAKGRHDSPIVPEKKEQGPWTVEATDLFNWRPPDWEDRLKKKAVSCG